MDNLKSAFSLKSGGYEAKGAIFMKKNKLVGLREPLQDGEPATKKYVDDTTKNLFIDENDNIAFGLNVDMDGNKIFSLPEPEQDNEPATKKYVDDLQTQYIDKRGNVKFDRNINVGNNRIFAVKDPKKDYEATNKKYVDESITKRLQEEKDNFLPQDPATKEYVDEAIKQVAGGDLLVSKEGVFIKANGHYRATAPLDIDNHKMENLPDPVDEKDAVNKKYIDGIVENLTLKQGLIRENGGFNLVDSYINMNFNNIRNVGYPKHIEDAVPRSFVDDMIGSLKETTEKTTVDAFTRFGKMLTNGLKKRKHIITTSVSYKGDLIKGEYQFPFGGVASMSTGFLVPQSGRIKKVKISMHTGPGIIITGPDIPGGSTFFNNNVFSIMLIRKKEEHNNEEEKEFEFVETDLEEIYLSTYKCKITKFKNVCFKTTDTLIDYPLLYEDIINIKTEIDYIKTRPGEPIYTFMFTFVIELDPLENKEEDDD